MIELTSFDTAEVGSARLVVVWLADGDVYHLSALRPHHAKGQDRDEVAVSLGASEAAHEVFDPRLSTEYDADGTPRRFGLELWLGEDPDADLRSLRLAGETPSGSVGLREGRLSVHPMVARAAGIDGLALYLLYA